MAQSTLIFSLPELEIIVERFLVQGKLVPEEDRTHAASVLSAFLNFAASDDKEKEEIVPLVSSVTKTLAIFNTPEAVLFNKNYNKDAKIENQICKAMNTEVQTYSKAEDEMIDLAAGLNKGLKMKGAIPFVTYKTTFSTISFLKGFYNKKEGDIYTSSIFKVRSEHSLVAARFANYHYHCMNPAFGVQKEELGQNEVYLEVPNSHSAVICQEWKFPSPMSDREAITNICWKRLDDKTVVVAYQPLTSHPLVENKDGGSMIRGSFHAVYRVTQLDDGTTEVDLGLHVNFGGKLPQSVVH
ncbi:hypothetical protein TrVE_jg2060 [Triparma verrucosa]|uniref:Uncharacterized protein n=1 Tax=Triparma verrucosa TaxID=1606542 RepID=A0A9W7BNM7_9STRA|nr:hypothetical protein TrVE_jg2060 [Triparma verrucosa]